MGNNTSTKVKYECDEEIDKALKGFAKVVDDDINNFLDRFLMAMNIPNVIRKEIYAAVVGGKHVRSTTLFRTFLGEMSKRIVFSADHVPAFQRIVLPFCVAIEIYHASALVHDDIVDEDKTRRGRPASWVTLGIPQAIFLGDFLKSAANASFHEGSTLFISTMSKEESFGAEDVEYFLAMLNTFWNAMQRDVEIGQMLDYQLSQEKLPKPDSKNLKKEVEKLKEKCEEIISLKTSSYTFATPMIIAAIITMSSENRMDELLDIGEEMGYDFQIANDKEGIEKDRKAGKITIPLLDELL